MMKKTYGVMLVGCGHIGMEHLMDIYYRPNIRVVAVVDTNIEKAKEAALRCNAKVFGTDYRAFLQDESVDIVVVATYTDTHLEIVRECLAHHKHVLCEKPIGLDLEEGKDFLQLVKNAKEKVLVSHVLRHNRSYQIIKELIDNGEIGELRFLRMVQNHHAMNWQRYCRLMEDCSPAMDCGVHYFDLAQWLANSPIIRVNGFGTKTQPDAPQKNQTLVTFTMENGCTGFYEAGWGQSIRSSNEKEFIGTKGRITLEMRANRLQDGEEGDLITLYQSETGTYQTINVQTKYKNMYSQMETLIQMIEENTPGTPTIDQVFSAFTVSLAANKAVEQNGTVHVKQIVG